MLWPSERGRFGIVRYRSLEVEVGGAVYRLRAQADEDGRVHLQEMSAESNGPAVPGPTVVRRSFEQDAVGSHSRTPSANVQPPGSPDY